MRLPLRPIWWGFLVVALASVLFSARTATAQQQTFRIYGTADGLSNLNLRCLLQDRTGFLWVGTDNGLFRFDGASFREFGHPDGLPNTEIHAIAESPQDGSLWVATPGGLAQLENGKFQPVPSPMPGDAATVSAIVFTPAGDMYVQNSYGILKRTSDYVGGWLFEPVAAGDVHGLLLHDGAVYFGWNRELWRVEDRRAEPVGTVRGLPADVWTALVSDYNGNLWVRSRTSLWEFPRGGSRFVNRSAGISPTDDTQLAVDRHGHLFVNTLSGAVEIDHERQILLDGRHGLAGDGVGPMLVDREDSLWLGLTGGGLARRLGHGEWTSWKRSDGLPHNTVWSILRDRAGDIWAGTSAGLAMLDPAGKVRRVWTTHNGLPAGRVLSLAQAPGGDIFAGSDPVGITQFTPEGRLLRTYGAREGLSQRVTAMAVDHRDRLWAIGNGGVFRSTAAAAAGASLRFQPMPVPGTSPDTFFRSIVITPENQVWVATSRGLFCFDGAVWDAYTTANGLLSDDLDAIAERSGELWIAYRDAIGMSRAHVVGNRLQGVSVTTRNGLSSDDLYALAFDSEGRLWANSDKGVNVLENGVWRHFGSEDGLIWDDTNSAALFIDSDNSVWIGTSGGMSRYVRPSYGVRNSSASVVMTTIRGSGHHVWRADEQPVIPFADRTLTFQFAALSFTSSRQRFRYRVLGYEDSWIETPAHVVQLAALPAGDYEFQVTAQNSDGSWDTQPARFAFTIRSPWWLRTPFLIAMVLLVVGVIRLLWMLRLRNLIAQKELLQRKVDEQTAELLESHRQLESIAYFDLLTSLPNRRMFGDEFRKRIHNARRNEESFALLVIDLDLFKQINDTFGHDAGDAVLVAVAARLQSAVRNCDCVARLGGDEFAILLTGSREKLSGGRGIDAVETVCRRILESCTRVVTFHQQSLQVGCSIGISTFPDDAEDEDALYKAADLALYHTKRNRGSSFTWYRDLKSLPAPRATAAKPSTGAQRGPQSDPALSPG